MNDDRMSHWDTTYRTKVEDQVSWFQQTPEPTLTLLGLADVATSSAIVDVGAGTSHLVDALIGQGYADISVLDISQAALEQAQARLGSDAQKVKWIRADVTAWRPDRSYDVWHDRATFHFLTDPVDQAAYAAVLTRALKPGGHVIIGTFAPDGPEKCSGLPVARHDANSLGKTLGSQYALIDYRRHDHITPSRVVQHFQFSTFRKASSG